MEYKIQELEKEKWQGHEIMFCDYADSVYSMEIKREDGGFSVLLIKKPLEQRKEIKYPNKLFEPWLTNIKAWGVIESGQLIAVIETAAGNDNRLYVSELWVDEAYRRRGIATALMNTAKARAVEEKRRAIYLETRSCNEHAIDFYISQGFTLIGFDCCAYSNEDIKRNNVPLKLGYFPQ